MPNVFISYSHADHNLLKNMKRHLSALKGKVDFWDDSRILPGMKWKEEISMALSRAQIGVLLISADFLNSSFIMEEELPFLLKASENGLTILSIILKPCLFNLYPEISKFQALNSPSKTVIQMTEAEQETIWTQLILRIHELVS